MGVQGRIARNICSTPNPREQALLVVCTVVLTTYRSLIFTSMHSILVRHSLRLSRIRVIYVISILFAVLIIFVLSFLDRDIYIYIFLLGFEGKQRREKVFSRVIFFKFERGIILIRCFASAIFIISFFLSFFSGIENELFFVAGKSHGVNDFVAYSSNIV